jgi:hypothetical protein
MGFGFYSIVTLIAVVCLIVALIFVGLGLSQPPSTTTAPSACPNNGVRNNNYTISGTAGDTYCDNY